jgi:[ribosomal protein S5]-alanine N-acetyltransferase
MAFASDEPYGDFHLVTPRTGLRPFTRDDLPLFSQLYSEPVVMRFLADGVPFTPRQVADRFARLREHYRTQGFGVWAVVDRHTHKIIGRAGLQHLSEVEEVEVSYAFLPDQWGKGLATEVAGALVAYGLERVNFPRIVATVSPANKASIRVLEKIGMHSERVLELAGGKTLLFSVSRSEWESQKAANTAAAGG